MRIGTPCFLITIELKDTSSIFKLFKRTFLNTEDQELMMINEQIYHLDGQNQNTVDWLLHTAGNTSPSDHSQAGSNHIESSWSADYPSGEEHDVHNASFKIADKDLDGFFRELSPIPFCPSEYTSDQSSEEEIHSLIEKSESNPISKCSYRIALATGTPAESEVKKREALRRKRISYKQTKLANRLNNAFISSEPPKDFLKYKNRRLSKRSKRESNCPPLDAMHFPAIKRSG
ncbi:Uncharacterized protein FKW44_021628 [Caligus rogercresseyi]|uniref:Uncharacterized protein n=1 Tax=Caligus rogercresseyi TaxID=217165 RepID=A0A7T8GRL4_CALRO|nr:Uncharacterized protein FKW44_021628 [Caligus rogercresseyi]